MDCQIGICGGTGGDGYVILASDCNAARSIVVSGKMKGDLDKMMVVGSRQVICYSGEPGDTTQMAEYIQANLKLAAIRANGDMSPHAAANWMRNQMASSIRSRSPKAVSLLFGGYDVNRKTASLYSIDQLGTLNKSPFACHGYASYFCMSTLDRYHEPSQGWEKGIETLKKCISELQIRFIINLGTWKVRVITKDGIKEITIDDVRAPANARAPQDAQMEA
ncbi:Proteasome subunit beta type-4 [Cystobasidiomycetes sp. EMM_F5]